MQQIAWLTEDLPHTYAGLRHAWAIHWQGLPAVVSGCLRWLAQQSHPQCEPDAADLPQVLVGVAHQVEQLGRDMASDRREPAYHNRLHIADTLVSMTCLLRAQRLLEARQCAPLCVSELLCLLCMLVHDLGHDGSINRVAGELEQRSVALFAPLLSAAGLASVSQQVIAELVLLTDPAGVKRVHAQCRGRASPCDVRGGLLPVEQMAVWVTEADVMASALPSPGLELTRALAQEWAVCAPAMSQRLLTARGRLGFLQNGAWFSSGACVALGIPAIIDRQIAVLQRGDVGGGIERSALAYIDVFDVHPDEPV